MHKDFVVALALAAVQSCAARAPLVPVPALEQRPEAFLRAADSSAAHPAPSLAERRDAWWRELRPAPRGVDPVALELANDRARRARREALHGGSDPAARSGDVEGEPASASSRWIARGGLGDYHATLSSAADPRRVVAGSADQGWQRSRTASASSSADLDFESLLPGDYAHAVSNGGEPVRVYASHPDFVLIHLGADPPELFAAALPVGETHAYHPPLVADPEDGGSFFLLATHLWRYQKDAHTNGFSATLASEQDFELSRGEYLSALAFSPADRSRVFAATSRGRLWRSNDGGATWTPSETPPLPYFHATAIAASTFDVETVWVVGSGYGGAPVWRSTDGGRNYEPFAEGLPSTLVHDLAEAGDFNGTLFLATESGPWRRDAEATAWSDASEGVAPIVAFTGVEAVGRQVMRFATRGAGIWDYALPEACRYTPYGRAIGGANALLLESTSETTELGTTHAFRVSGMQPACFGFFVVSLRDSYEPALGGVCLVSQRNALVRHVQAKVNGVATFDIATPDEPELRGLSMHIQAAFADPGGPEGWLLSNGLRGVMCASE